MGAGGKRAGAGRKVEPDILEFRNYWRKKFDQPRWRKWLAMKAIRNERILALLLNQAYGAAPQAIKVEVNDERVERQIVFPGGEIVTPASAGLPEERPN